MSASAEYMRAWRAKNLPRLKIYAAAYREANREKTRLKYHQSKTPERMKLLAERARVSYHKNKHKIDREAQAKRYSEWRKKNQERLKNYHAEWVSRNKERNAAHQKKYFLKNADKVRHSNAQWRARVGKKYFQDWEKKNPGIRTEYSNRRRARVQGATYDDSAKAFYRFVRSQQFVECSYCSEIVSGKSAHIDHLIALSRGGMHVASNLRISCKKCNLSKHTKTLKEWKPELVGLI